MSKLFQKFEELKKNNPEKLYLLKSGIFYIGLNEDAKKLSQLFDFKITNLNDTTKKCGFPEKKLEFYTKLLTSCSVDFEIVDDTGTKVQDFSGYLQNENAKEIIKKIQKLDMNTISFQQAFNLLNDFHEKLK